LAARGQLATAADVAWLTWTDLGPAMAGQTATPHPVEPGPPLPAQFRLDISGAPVGVHRHGVRGSGGVGAGGGRAVGVVVHDPAAVIDGSILVTRTLDPRLSAVLPRLAGIVAETGSTLSHLAILAREAGVPAVVAVPDAMSRFTAGSRLLVDVEEAP
jgi:pyruvate,water dikinase